MNLKKTAGLVTLVLSFIIIFSAVNEQKMMPYEDIPNSWCIVPNQINH